MKSKLFNYSNLILFFLLAGSSHASAASSNGTMQAQIIAALGISNVSALDFGIASPGDTAKVVPPSTVENATNGSFNVTGQPNTAYTIQLPATALNMITGIGGANRTIAVSTFVSFPAAGVNGLLSAAGAQLLLVGATRAALPATQITGSYTGTYSVTVIY